MSWKLRLKRTKKVNVPPLTLRNVSKSISNNVQDDIDEIEEKLHELEKRQGHIQKKIYRSKGTIKAAYKKDRSKIRKEIEKLKKQLLDKQNESNNKISPHSPHDNSVKPKFKIKPKSLTSSSKMVTNNHQKQDINKVNHKQINIRHKYHSVPFDYYLHMRYLNNCLYTLCVPNNNRKIIRA